MQLIHYNFDSTLYNEAAVVIGMVFKLDISIYDDQHLIILMRTKKSAEKLLESGYGSLS